MVKSLFKDIFQTVFGFLITLSKLIKNPLGIYEVAKSGNGFKLGLSTFIWVLIFDVWVGKTMLSHATNYEFANNDNTEILLDYGNNTIRKNDSKENQVLKWMSTPIIKELVVFTRLVIALILLIPISLLLLGKQKNETDFRNFIGLNFLLSSFAALAVILLIAITFQILLATSSFQLLSLMHFIIAFITIIVGSPMLIVVYKNWNKMLPQIKKWRLNLSFFLWIIGGAIISKLL